MSQFMIFFGVIALAMAVWLSRFQWAKAIALVPVGALVPAFYGAAVNCGLGFALDFFGPGACEGGHAPRAVFAALYVIALAPVLVGTLLVKLMRIVAARR